MDCVIVDYGSGNVRSVLRALEHVADRHQVRLSDDPEVIKAADFLVLPGVGAFRSCRDALIARPKLLQAIHHQARERQRPFLGICVGMQLLADFGKEHVDCPGLGWIPGQVRHFDTTQTKTRAIPHMGWSSITARQDNPLMHGLPSEAMVYFVHSFVFEAARTEQVWAEAKYGESFSAIIGEANIMGTQFHPEKSQQVGLAILRNFLAL